jgi:hypothetical protein
MKGLSFILSWYNIQNTLLYLAKLLLSVMNKRRRHKKSVEKGEDKVSNNNPRLN